MLVYFFWLLESPVFLSCLDSSQFKMKILILTSLTIDREVAYISGRYYFYWFGRVKGLVTHHVKCFWNPSPNLLSWIIGSLSIPHNYKYVGAVGSLWGRQAGRQPTRSEAASRKLLYEEVSRRDFVRSLLWSKHNNTHRNPWWNLHAHPLASLLKNNYSPQCM